MTDLLCYSSNLKLLYWSNLFYFITLTDANYFCLGCFTFKGWNLEFCLPLVYLSSLSVSLAFSLSRIQSNLVSSLSYLINSEGGPTASTSDSSGHGYRNRDGRGVGQACAPTSATDVGSTNDASGCSTSYNS